MKKTNPDVSKDFDRRPPRKKVSIDVDDIHYWSVKINGLREYYPQTIRSIAKENTPRQFDLNLANPIETAVLLRILADLLFGPRRKKGRPLDTKKWTGKRLDHLALDFEEVKKGRPKLSDAKAAVIIKKRNPERYKDTSSEMMRQRLPEARLFRELRLEKLMDHCDPDPDYADEGFR